MQLLFGFLSIIFPQNAKSQYNATHASRVPNLDVVLNVNALIQHLEQLVGTTIFRGLQHLFTSL